MARAVNFVWNFCNETQRAAIQRGDRWPSAFTLIMLTAGTSTDLGLRAEVIAEVCRFYVRSRQGARRRLLRWRGRQSLGWVPLRGRNIRFAGSCFRIHKADYFGWISRPIIGTVVDGSSFSSDARGRWYLNVVSEEPDVATRAIESSVGIDLGLKDFAVFSNGERVPPPMTYRSLCSRLAVAQRSSNRARTRALLAKAANQRRDFHHKLSTDIVRRFDLISCGDVSPSKLKRTRLAKSVSDAGWSQFRSFLRYKAIRHGATYREVREHLTTQTCSTCGSIGGPKGRQGLGVRQWACGACGSVHDRDVNAAKNIAGLGHGPHGSGTAVSPGCQLPAQVSVPDSIHRPSLSSFGSGIRDR